MKKIELANDMTAFYPLLPESGGNNGGIYAANDANFDAEHLSEPLVDYIVGAEDDEGLVALLDAAAPVVPVGRAFTYRQHDTKESFQSDHLSDLDIREIGGDFAQIRRTGIMARRAHRRVTAGDAETGRLIPSSRCTRPMPTPTRAPIRSTLWPMSSAILCRSCPGRLMCFPRATRATRRTTKRAG